jgi:hypothetical protein
MAPEYDHERAAATAMPREGRSAPVPVRPEGWEDDYGP